MYVSYEQFLENTVAAVPMQPTTDAEPVKADITEEQYVRLAPMADLVIDDWTLDRVGRAVRNGEDLPPAVITLYCAMIETLPGIMEGVKPGKGGLVSSFSNGIDSFSFAVTPDISEQLENTLGWMRDLLPIEWCSAVVGFEGGNRYAG